MARARNIKPGFFNNEVLAECKFESRLLFAGLWTIADREGRLEDRPRKIKAEVLPYDNVNVDKLLDELATKKDMNGNPAFIIRYTSNGTELNDTKHDKEYGANSSEVCTMRSSTQQRKEQKDKDVLQAISYYFDTFRRKLRKKHPRINKWQHERVYDEIAAFMWEFNMNMDDMQELIDCHFVRTYTWEIDYNINHFANEEILKNCMYDAGIY